MSKLTRRQAFLGVGLAIIAAPTLSACQFQPLYGTTSSGRDLRHVMKAVEVARIPGRVGQQLRNELIFTTTGGGYPADPEYDLLIVIRESVTNILVERTGDAQGKQYNLDANFQLVRRSDKEVVLKGTSTSRAAFDKYEPIYSNVRAERDAENRAARHVADNIKTRIAAFLSSSA